MLSEQDSVAAAERELRDRERRHGELELRPLDPEAHQRYSVAWQEIQARFVDAPTSAVGDAHELVSKLIGERGYPTDDHDEQLATLSVDHARTLGHYRDAHEIYLRNERGEATTEQLRQALVHYRTLFADLLGQEHSDAHDGRVDSRADTDRDARVNGARVRNTDIRAREAGEVRDADEVLGAEVRDADDARGDDVRATGDARGDDVRETTRQERADA